MLLTLGRTISLLLWPLRVATIFFLGMFPTLMVGRFFSQFVFRLYWFNSYLFSIILSWTQKKLRVPKDSKPGHFKSSPFLNYPQPGSFIFWLLSREIHAWHPQSSS